MVIVQTDRKHIADQHWFFFLSNRSVNAPAKMLISTYGTYEQMVSAAVLNDEPVFSYSHNVQRKTR